ncbi:MAG: hypothetical protein QGG80_00200 [Candidatus Krumholzibacteria bacterium]|nr:hypothetical protein [Candidatus Krumholzibacteria bacterium]MDP7021418.1 hypothetical protein [Candidatus Krumholzibacteria bacterium]
MSLSSGFSRILAVSALLLLMGFSLDFGFTQPRIGELDRMIRQLDQLREEESRMQGLQREERGLIRFLESQGLEECLSDSSDSGPAEFLGERLEAAGLERLEMRSTEISAGEHMKRTRFFLRVLGTYSSTLDFLRTLESGARLVSIEAIRVEAQSSSRSLETRLELSLYDPAWRN